MSNFCIALSAGGHFEEMQLLKDKFLRKEDKYFYYSFKSEIYDRLKEEIYLTIDPKRNPFLHLWNFLYSFFIFFKKKPDVILTNGASVAFSMVFLGWFFRKKVIYVDSICRTKSTSLFGRIVYPFSKEFYVLWENMVGKYGRKTKYLYNPLNKLNVNYNDFKNAKRVFVSVGSSRYNSERLIKFADKIASLNPDKEFFCQIGYLKVVPKFCKYTKFLNYSAYQDKMRTCDFFISYSGSGSLISAIRYGKPFYFIPRLEKYGEAANDHQLDLWYIILKNIDAKLKNYFSKVLR